MNADGTPHDAGTSAEPKHSHDTIMRALSIASSFNPEKHRAAVNNQATGGRSHSKSPRHLGNGSSRREGHGTRRSHASDEAEALSARPSQGGVGVGGDSKVAVRLAELKRLLEEGSAFKMCQFEHVEGCTVCKDLYGHYTLPDGRTIHYYLNDNLNEVVRRSMMIDCCSAVGLRTRRRNLWWF